MPDIPEPSSPSTLSLTDAEWAECVLFAKEFYEILAEFVPGDTTVNQLRILTSLAVADATGEGTSVSEIADEYGISRATVSRLITEWMTAGRITETPYPGDGRRRVLGLNEEAQRYSRMWAERLSTILPPSSPEEEEEE